MSECVRIYFTRLGTTKSIGIESLCYYNFKETLKALKEIGYNKSLALEIVNVPDTETAAVKSLAYLKGLLEIV